MANQYFQQFLYSKIKQLVLLQGKFKVGAAGAVSSFAGLGIKSVVKLGADGTYRIRLTDNYVGLLQALCSKVSPNTGAAVASAALVPGTLYTITVVGTTNWVTAGVPSDQTPAVGLAFVATAVSAGTGTATAVGDSGIETVESAPGADLTALGGTGKGCNSVIVQCIDSAGALANAASGTEVNFALLLRNSTALT